MDWNLTADNLDIDVALPNLLFNVLLGGFRPLFTGVDSFVVSAFLGGFGLLLDVFLFPNSFNFSIPEDGGAVFSEQSCSDLAPPIVLTVASFGMLTAFGGANLELPIFVVVATRTCCEGGLMGFWICDVDETGVGRFRLEMEL